MPKEDKVCNEGNPQKCDGCDSECHTEMGSGCPDNVCDKSKNCPICPAGCGGSDCVPMGLSGLNLMTKGWKDGTKSLKKIMQAIIRWEKRC